MNGLEAPRQCTLREVACAVGHADHHRIQESRQKRRPNGDREHRVCRIIDKLRVEDRHHERKLADLREGETVLDGGLDVDARKKGSKRVVEELAEDDDERDDEYRASMRPERGRVDKKTDRDEEHRGEHRLERINEGRQPLAHVARRAEEADKKCAERKRKVEAVGKERDEEADAKNRESKRLVVLPRRDRHEETRHVNKPDHDHRKEKYGKPAKRRGECAGRHPTAIREPRRDGDCADADYVFAE